ncbi:HPr kinase/phosphatase C-terminal domain-containing protein [uncultured Sphingomonas sp.]|uniref:HPr kinase/phosphorylase n=1 Tax=uncultured Sphingomonas sp. TaxID=158754 RepID=UPI0030F8C76C
MTATIHATCVAIGARGVLLTGPSGAGKSDLAMRLIDRGAVLVADDYTVLSQEDGVLIARSPATIAGRMEVRGIGIVARPTCATVQIALSVVLASEDERLPEPRAIVLDGVTVPEVVIDPRWPSAPIKVEWALAEQPPVREAER